MENGVIPGAAPKADSLSKDRPLFAVVSPGSGAPGRIETAFGSEPTPGSSA